MRTVRQMGIRIAAFGLISLPSIGASPPAYDFSSVQNRLTAKCAHGSFSGVLAVQARGKEVLSHVCGLSNLESKAPITRETRFRILSISKLLTALAVMRLQELRTLRLDDSIATYIPEVPPEWRGVTLRHLLAHTSGLPDETEALLAAWTTDHPTALRLVLAANTARHTQPSTTPGAEWKYNNFGYELLAEAASGVFSLFVMRAWNDRSLQRRRTTQSRKHLFAIGGERPLGDIRDLS